jgi:hypothetical protein
MLCCSSLLSPPCSRLANLVLFLFVLIWSHQQGASAGSEVLVSPAVSVECILEELELRVRRLEKLQVVNSVITYFGIVSAVTMNWAYFIVVPVQPWACSLEQIFMARIVISHAQVTSNLFSLDTLNLQVCYLTSMCGKIPHYISIFLEPSNDDWWSFHVNFDGLSYSQTYILCYLTSGLMDVLYVRVCGVLTVPALPTLSFINFLLSINLRFFCMQLSSCYYSILLPPLLNDCIAFSMVEWNEGVH